VLGNDEFMRKTAAFFTTLAPVLQEGIDIFDFW